MPSETLKSVLIDARNVLRATSSVEQAEEILKRIHALPASKRVSTLELKLNVLKTLAEWRMTGEIKPNYKNLNEARIQFWYIETKCPVFNFQKQFLAVASQDFVKAKGIAQLLSVYQHIESVEPTPHISPADGIVKILRPGAKKTFLVFAGNAMLISGLTACLFDRAIAQGLNANIIVCYDTSKSLFLRGIEPIGNRAETIAYLRSLVDSLKETEIIAIGGSGGVFGALHASCDLGLERVIACAGPTDLHYGLQNKDRQTYQKIFAAAEAGELEIVDLPELVAKSSIKRVDFFVSGKSDFDIGQLDALRSKADVVVPHVYEDTDDHAILWRMIVDGSLLNTIAAASETEKK